MNNRARGVCLAVFFAALVGCEGVPFEPSDGPPLQVPGDLSRLPDPIPRDEPKSARGNPPSYVVFGKTYQVRDSAVGYAEEGNASWYGRKFHGRTTSSGEPFDMFKLTAAHRSLPIPSYVRVTHLGNGKSVVLRVNDRGPFHDERIIDLSYAAAVRLGFADQGTAPVKVHAITKEQEFVLQAGAFRDLAAADHLKQTLGQLTGETAHVVRVGTDHLYRVRLGPVHGRARAERLQSQIAAANLGQPLIMSN